MSADRTPTAAPPGQAALAVFSDQTRLWWLRPLKPGFRHCFAALRLDDHWVVIDPLSHWTQVALAPGRVDLAAHYRAHGLTVVETRAAPPRPRPCPWRPATCVETVKRVLGIQAGSILTPWQLFLYLSNKGKNTVDFPARIGNQLISIPH